MTTIPSGSPIQGNPNYAGAQVSQNRQVEAREAFNAGVTIQTREGDVVTLNASSFAEMGAGEYNSQGVVATGNGVAAASSHVREITLSTGESFSFSVQGDLSEEELKDIEAILKGVDDIVSEMSELDMDGAMAQAVELTMGKYDSVASYSADLSYQRSYAYTQTETAQAYTGNAPGLAQAGGTPPPPPAVEEENVEEITAMNLLKELLESMEQQEDKLLERSRLPLDSLFDKYQKDAEEEGNTLAQQDLDALHTQVSSFIKETMQNVFGQALDQFA